MTDFGFHYRDAIRLLYILTGLADPIKPAELQDSDHTHAFNGEKRLMALDFYIRYPDYLADQLLNQYEETGQSNPNLLNVAKDIMKGDEPDIRTILMVRWKRGAYQKIDTALAILEAPGLIKTVQNTALKGKPWSYLIYPKAFEVAKDAVSQQPSLEWYPKQVSALMLLPYHDSGTSLKDKQYQNFEYGNTKLGNIIPQIKSRVIERLENVK